VFFSEVYVEHGYFSSVYAEFTQSLRRVYAESTSLRKLSQFAQKLNVYAEFTQCLRSDYAVFTQCLCNVYAMFTRYLRSVYAVFTQCLRSVCGNACLFALCLRSYMFTQVGICLRNVYAVFTQCLRNVYADLFLFAQCGHLRKRCHFFACLRMFTHVYACLRMFTHIVRKRNNVYAMFTQCLRMSTQVTHRATC
jgi:hypothetical protein